MRIILAIAIAGLLASCAKLPTRGAERLRQRRVLVFTKTQTFRHESIPAGIEAVHRLGRQYQFEIATTEDASAFTPENLAHFAAVVLLNTSGDVLDNHQQSAFQGYIERGGGFVGVHAAADTEHQWDWYLDLVGARFVSHPQIQPATIVVNVEHVSTRHLPKRWNRTDEWYDFDAHPRTRIGSRLMLLASLDESSYAGGSMAGDHPIAWCHEVEAGRAWYTAGGHTIESYTEPDFVKHLLGGILWAGRIETVHEHR